MVDAAGRGSVCPNALGANASRKADVSSLPGSKYIDDRIGA
jgi:hypothetical protein